MQLVLVVTTVCAVIAGIEAYVPLSAYTKVSSTTTSTTTTQSTPVDSEKGENVTEAIDSPWEEKIVYGNNEVSYNKRVNDRFLDKEEKPLAANNRNKRQHEITRLPSDSTQAKRAIANVESVIKHVEDVIDEYRSRDAKRAKMRLEHRESSFELPPERNAKQGFDEPESRIVNRGPQPALSSVGYSGFRPMTSIGNRLATYVNPSSPSNPFVTGSPAPFVNPQQQQQQQQYYYVPSRQPYAGNPYSPTDFSFPEPQQQQPPYNYPQQQQPAYSPQQPVFYYNPRPQTYYQYQQRPNYPTQLVTHHIPVTIAIPITDPFEQHVHDPRAGRRVNTPPPQSVAVSVRRPSQTPILDRIRGPSRRPAELSVNIFRQK